MNARLVVIVSLLSSLAALAAPEKPKLLVTAVQPGGGVDAQVANAMTDAVASEVARRGFFSVMSANDVQSLLGMERQRQLTGCTDEAASACLSELAGAVGVRFVLNGTLTKLGDAYQLTLQTLDTQKAQPLGRASRIANDLKSLQLGLPYAVAEATATPLPPPPSRVLPFTLIGVGAAATIAGGVIGINALSQDGAMATELQKGQSNPAVLGDLQSYRDQAREIGNGRTAALSLLAAGAVTLGIGVFLLPSSSQGGGGSVAMLVAGPNGAAVVGAF